MGKKRTYKRPTGQRSPNARVPAASPTIEVGKFCPRSVAPEKARFRYQDMRKRDAGGSTALTRHDHQGYLRPPTYIAPSRRNALANSANGA